MNKDELSISGTWRYKITVNVETPEGLKSGFAVREVTVSDSAPLIRLPESLPRKDIKGEAVAVDLGARGVLFAIMDVDGSYRHVFDAFPYPRPLSFEGIRYYDALNSGVASLHPEQYPMMVRFRDLNDPKSVELAYSATPYDARDDRGRYIGRKIKITDNIDALFGQGVRIKDVKIEMTDETVTNDLINHLVWLGDIKSNIDGTNITQSNDLSNALNVGNFKRGNVK